MDAIERYRDVPSAVLSNAASLWPSGRSTLMELHHRGFRLCKYFTPEHGSTAKAVDGSAQADGLEEDTGVPLLSLYGEKWSPTPDDLNDIEVVMVDLPNIGCRFYTYWWTITYMMEACAESGKRLVLLDRPNISGRRVEEMEGPLLEETCASFLGRWPMPLTYAQTYGELLQHFVRKRKINLDYEILPIHPQGIPFVPPSPAIRSPETAVIYPFTALFEGLNLNYGRGTDTPFFLLGAPWLEAKHFLKKFKQLGLEGIGAETTDYIPESSTYAKKSCHGLRFNVTDSSLFRPVKTAIRVIKLLLDSYPEHVMEAVYPTAANPTGERHLDLLLGVQGGMEQIRAGTLENKLPLTNEERLLR